jgi:glutathione synthase/RimK-type ligase-like ATP-grasp enzyme
MQIIVLSHPKDDHAAPVQWALAQAGYQVTCWSGVSWTEQEQASLVPGQQPRIFLGLRELEDGDAVWLRQPSRPEHDLEISGAGKSSSPSAYPAFFDSIAYMLEALPVRCINSFSASRLVTNKGVQLYLAGASGLMVPATLMSNSPTAVRHFFEQYPDNAICKPFAGHIWQQQGSEEIAVTETFCLSREQLPPDNEVFTYSPAIYQQMVAKEFDVRVVMMEERIYSFALRTPENSLDWRYDAAARNLSVEIVRTPPEVEAGLRRFRQKTGACFGVMDFAVDRTGAWWFLEINEQGQFLWLDRFNAKAGLLEKFCAFLTATPGSAQSLEERQERFPSLAEYENSHQNEEVLDITAAAPGADYKSMEP